MRGGAVLGVDVKNLVKDALVGLIPDAKKETVKKFGAMIADDAKPSKLIANMGLPESFIGKVPTFGGAQATVRSGLQEVKDGFVDALKSFGYGYRKKRRSHKKKSSKKRS